MKFLLFLRLTVPFETLEVIPANVNHDEKDFPSEVSSSGK